MNKFYKKYIRIPPNESIDIRKIGGIIHHPLFQRLLHISQLGTALMVFPGAKHTRFEHALGVYGKTLRFSEKMVKDGFLTPKEGWNVSLFALLHDIGHGPFSHVIEELTPESGDEDENGLVVLKRFKKEIIKSGGDYKLITDIFKHKNPLYKIVMDKNVGMDKLDYLERDTYHTGFGQRPDVESIFNYLVYLKGNLVIDKKSLEAAKQMQKLYLYMYKEVYLHKSSLICQRFLQKMISKVIGLDNLEPSSLWMMNDTELLSRVLCSTDKQLLFLYNCYKDRNLPRVGLVVRLKNKEFKERIAGKKIKVIGEDRNFFNQFLKLTSPQSLASIEAKIAKLIKIDEHKVIIVPTVTPWRFVPEDILYHDDGQILSLKSTHKDYFVSMKAEMDDYMAVRVCIIGDRKVIYKNSSGIYRILKKEIE